MQADDVRIVNALIGQLLLQSPETDVSEVMPCSYHKGWMIEMITKLGV